jgi:hypothetical protein
MWCRSYLADRSQSYIVGKNQTVSLPLTCGVPQGSSLGPQKFISYAEGIAAALTRSAINYDLFADDVQLNASARVDKIHIATKLLESCVADVADCCASRRLQLNPTKFEIAWFGSRANLRRIADDDARCLRISADTVIKPVDVVRNLGILLDSELTMKQHVNKIASVCYFHLRRLHQLRRSFARTRRDEDACLCIHLITPRLLQRCARRSAEVDDRHTATRSECCRSTGPRPSTARQRRRCIETTALDAHLLPHQIQTLRFGAWRHGSPVAIIHH